MAADRIVLEEAMLPLTLNLEQEPWHSLHQLCQCLYFPFLLTSVIPKYPLLVHEKSSKSGNSSSFANITSKDEDAVFSTFADLKIR